MKKFLVFALAMTGLTQGNRHMNGFDDHHGDHLVHESRIDPIDVGHHRTVPDYVGHEDRIDGHRSSEHHDPTHSKILPQDILAHPLGGSKYEAVHDAVKHDKGVWHDHDHDHDHGHGHDEGHGHDLHSNDFFDGHHGEHGHGWHGDDHDDDDEHDHHGDRNILDHRLVHHDNPHYDEDEHHH